MINNIFKIVLSLSLSGAIIALILMLLKPLIKNKFSNTWQFYIWLIVVARLLLPYVPPVNLVNEMLKIVNQDEASIQIPSNVQADTELSTEGVVDTNFILPDSSIIGNENNEISNEQINNKSNAEIPLKPVLSARQEIIAFLQHSLSYISVIWLGISLILFVRKIISYYSFIRFVIKGSKIITDEQLLALYQNIGASMDIKKSPLLCTNSMITSPICIGFLKHYIILPEKQLQNTTNLTHIFRHELVHYKRFDIYYKWLMQVVICIHWFNPIVYFAAKQVNKYCELSCDEIVIKRMDTAEQRAYGDTLLQALELGGSHHSSVVSLTLTENTKLIKERLSAIMKFRKKSKTVVCLSAFFAIVLCIGSMFTGVYAQTTPTSKNEYQFGKDVKNPNITKESKEEGSISTTKTSAEITNDMKPIRNNSLYAVGYTSNWAAATSIEGDTYQKQLDEKIEWIEDTYNNKKERFGIVETVSSENELTNLTGAQYMLEKSSIYKNIISNNSSFLLTPYSGNWFSKTTKNNKEYERSIFYAEQSGTLTLNAKYDLSQGRMSVLIISPDSKIIYRNELSKQFDNIITVPVCEGLWSIATEIEFENGSIIGSKNMQGSFIPEANSKESVSRSDSLKQNFEKYKSFGVTYNTEEDAVYYNGERVKLFVDFKTYKETEMNYAFDLCYQDSNTNSIIYLEAVKNDKGNITGIKPLEKEIANELLLDMMVSADSFKPSTDRSKGNNGNIPFTVMDATHIIESADIVAKDLTKEKAGESIKNWMAQCDKKQGAYILKIKTAIGYDTYVYYNGGGRYPWNMKVEGGTINIELYSGSSLATNDGYYLMHYTAPTNDKSIKLYLDDKALNYTESSNYTQTNTQNYKLIEKEYSKADLKALNVSGIVVEAFSENISITRGGETLKLKYYQSSDDEYTLNTQSDMGGKIQELKLVRTSPVTLGETPRTIFVTIPDDLVFEVVAAETDNGNVTIKNVKAKMLTMDTNSGEIAVKGCAADNWFSAKTTSGNIAISATNLPKGSYLESDTGATIVQLADDAKNYQIHVDTKAEAKIDVNGKLYAGGDFTINKTAEKNIYYDSIKGSLIIKDMNK